MKLIATLVKISIAAVIVYLLTLIAYFTKRKNSIETACKAITVQLVDAKILKDDAYVSAVSDPIRTFYYSNFYSYGDYYGYAPKDDGTCQINPVEGYMSINIRKTESAEGLFIAEGYQLLRLEHWIDNDIDPILWDRIPQKGPNCPSFNTVSYSPSDTSKIIEETGCNEAVTVYVVPTREFEKEDGITRDRLFKSAGYFLGYRGHSKPSYEWTTYNTILVTFPENSIIDFDHPSTRNGYLIEYALTP